MYNIFIKKENFMLKEEMKRMESCTIFMEGKMLYRKDATILQINIEHQSFS